MDFLPAELLELLNGRPDAVLAWWKGLPEEARSIALGVAATIIGAPLLWMLSRLFRYPPPHEQANPFSELNPEAAVKSSAAPSPTASIPATPIPQAPPVAPATRSTVAAATLSERGKRIEELTEPGKFFGREPDVAELNRIVADNEGASILITGPGGVGKSALLANWAKAKEAAGARIASHFFSLRYPATRSVVDAYRALLVQLRDHLGDAAVPEIPDEERPLRDALTAAMQRDVASDTPLIVILDALDEADGGVPSFIPHRLGKNITVLVSERVDTDGEPDRLKPWLSEKASVPFPLGPLKPEGVVTWLRSKLPADLDIDTQAIAAKLERTTDGTPLFLQYVALF